MNMYARMFGWCVFSYLRKLSKSFYGLPYPRRGAILRTRRDQPWRVAASYKMGNVSVSQGTNLPKHGVEHPRHLAVRLKIEQSYTSNSLLGLHCLLYCKFHLYFLTLRNNAAVAIIFVSNVRVTVDNKLY